MEYSDEFLQKLEDLLKEAFANPCIADSDEAQMTDIHIQPCREAHKAVVYDDDDQMLAEKEIDELADWNEDSFYSDIESALKIVTERMKKNKSLDKVNIMQPFYFVLVDQSKETINEFDVVDDNTLLLHGDLLKGLDEELDSFLENLMKE